MFGVGPTELAFFLVIVLLAVGPEKLPTFMRTVGKGVRQVRNASREFKDAIGLDELMREGDPFRAPPVRPPVARPLPRQQSATSPEQSSSTTEETTAPVGAKPPPKTPPPPPPESLQPSAAAARETESGTSESSTEAAGESKYP
jgi:Sec-independent protein translocase protein TatA